MKFFKQACYIGYTVPELSKMSKLACKLPQNPFYGGFFKNKQGFGTSFQAIFYVKYFDNSFLW